MKRLSFYNLKDVRKCTEITLSVIGLSGLDKQMKSYSPGKSCLCCRLVRPYYDDYSSDHYSSYSYSEFSGSNVLNDEHFLYWGPIAFQLFKNETSNKTVDFIVQIIEQTEFFDEVTCKPLSNGVLTPYEDRALSVRIDSKSKIAYFSRDQVLSSPAVEVIKMPSTLHIYGFIIAYDVSVGVDTYNGIKQLQFLSSVLIRQNKIKKPTVIVLTKCDNAVLKSINHLYKWMNNNKFNNIIIETSAQYNVNVENIINYFLCHYYEQSNNFRNKQIKFKNFTYVDAFRQNNNRNIESTTAYVRLIRSYVVSYKMEFLQFLMNFTAEHLRIYELYTKFFGVQSASTLFDLHTKHLRHHFEDRLLNSHLNRLENAFEYFLPDISSIELNFWQWEKVREYIISDPRLIEKFRDISIAWNSDEV